jgi:hypothetical protein
MIGFLEFVLYEMVDKTGRVHLPKGSSKGGQFAPKNVLSRTIKKIVQQREDIWKNSIFKPLIDLPIDTRGNWGESFISDTLSNNRKFSIKWDENCIDPDGKYDIIINKKRVEVKTAFRGTKTHSWQHENLYSDHAWDKILFVDVDVDGIYFTVLNFNQMYFDKAHPVFGRKPTLRKNQTDKYKFDLSIKNIQKGIEHGLTFHYDLENDDELLDFFSSKF